MSTPVSCPACDSTSVGSPIKSGGYIYRVCGHCGHGNLDPIPPVGPIHEIYDKSYFKGGSNFGYLDYGVDADLHRRNARHRLKLIKRIYPLRAGKLLDFGCAYGYFLAEAEESGWEASGVEISAWARQEAARISRARIVPDFETLLAECAASFDVVCFFQVLEHCPSPLQTLRTARALLKPEGFIVLETWDKASMIARIFGNRWQQVSPPSVIHLFTRSSLSEMMQHSGFEKPSIHATSKYMSLGTVTQLLANKVPLLSGVPGWGLSTKATRAVALPYFLPDLVFASARKFVGGSPPRDVLTP